MKLAAEQGQDLVPITNCSVNKPDRLEIPLTLEQLCSSEWNPIHFKRYSNGRLHPVEIRFKVKPGWRNGQFIHRLSSYGNERKGRSSTNEREDLELFVKELKHGIFTCQPGGYHVYVPIKISLVAALYMREQEPRTFDGLHGQKLSVGIPRPTVQHKSTSVIEGQGMPDSNNKRGDLIVVWDVGPPSIPYCEQQLSQWRNELGQDWLKGEASPWKD